MKKFLVLALAASAFVTACGDDDEMDSMNGTGGTSGEAGAPSTGGRGGSQPSTGGMTSGAGADAGGQAAAGEGGGDSGGSGGSGGESGSSAARTFTVTVENVAAVKPFTSAGVFHTPEGDDKAGPLTPGKTYEFTVDAGRRQKLSFVTMLAATNDLFFAPKGDGIAFYDEDGEPISGDVTDQIYLWDAGTELNEEPRVGPNTVSKQGAPDTGPAENGDVIAIGDAEDDFDFDYPEASDVMTVTLTHVEGTEFEVTIENVSSATALQTSEGDFPAPLSPGVWVVHNGIDPLFTVGMPDRGQGLEHIAEDGNPTLLAELIAENSGITYPASPGVWVVHAAGTRPLFEEGSADYGEGLEHIAEDGNPMMLGAKLAESDGYLSGAVFNMPAGSTGPGPITPGKSYEFSFEATPGASLSFATMLAATNDVFFGPADTGIALFSANGEPLNGDITDEVSLWDAGTESNEQPGIGPTTVTNQPAPDTSNPGEESVQLLEDVDDGYDYPSVDAVLRVTVTSE